MPEILAVDIGGTNTAIGVVDRDGQVLYEKQPQLPTPQKKENPSGSQDKSDKLRDAYIDTLAQEIKTAIATVMPPILMNLMPSARYSPRSSASFRLKVTCYWHKSIYIARWAEDGPRQQ